MPLPESTPRPHCVLPARPDPLAAVAHESALRGPAAESSGADATPAIEKLLWWCNELRVRGDIARAMARELSAETAAIVGRMRVERSKRRRSWSTPDPE